MPVQIPSPVDVSFVTSGHDVADARLHREAAAMVRAGLEVEVLGLGRAHDGPPGTKTHAWPRRGPLGRAVLAVVLARRAHGHVLVSLDPDTALTCALAARLRGRRWVADVHEDYAALLRDRDWAQGVAGRAAAVLARVGTAVAAAADLTVVADDHVQPSAASARRRLVVRNLPDLDVVRSSADAPPGDGESQRAVYIGDGRRSRGLEAMLEAIAQAPGWNLDIIGPLHGAAAWAGGRVARDDLRGRVRLHGRLPPAPSWEIASRASVGLALLDDTPAFRAAIPTKVYEYLAAGLAVVATPLPRVAQLIEESGAGVVVPAADAGRALQEWTAHPGRLAAARERARMWSKDHFHRPSPYEALAAEVASLVPR